MPTYFLRCPACNVTTKRRLLLTLSEIPERHPDKTCEECGGPLKRAPRAPTTIVKESLDNGAMTKRVERFKDAEQLYADRAAQDPEKK